MKKILKILNLKEKELKKIEDDIKKKKYTLKRRIR